MNNISVRESISKAKNTLGEKNRRIALIWVELALIAFVIVAFFLSTQPVAVLALLNNWNETDILYILLSSVAMMLLFAMYLFVVGPIVSGYMAFAMALRKDDSNALLLFGAFESRRRYGRVLCHNLIKCCFGLVAMAVPGIIVVSVIPVMQRLYEAKNTAFWLVCVLTFLAVVAWLLFFAFLSGRRFLVSFMIWRYPEMTLTAAYYHAKCASFGFLKKIFAYRMRMFIGILFGLMTVGIYLFIYHIPNQTFSYLEMAESIESLYTSPKEDISNEQST